MTLGQHITTLRKAKKLTLNPGFQDPKGLCNTLKFKL